MTGLRTGAAAGVAAALLAAPAVASANGRPPATVSVEHGPGDTDSIFVGVTFGLLVSRDDGDTFRWVCEDAIGYGGRYDPDYEVGPDGALWATTFDGLQVSRDGGCSFETIDSPLLDQWIADVEVAPDGRVFAVTANGGDSNDVYVSTDGVSFSSVDRYIEDGWWKSLQIAPLGDTEDAPLRLYLTGYKAPQEQEGDAGTVPHSALLYSSDDGGATWQKLALDDLEFGNVPQLFVEAVSPTDPDVVFARVLGVNGATGDAIFRSADAGETWTRVLDMEDTISAFVVREDGATAIAGTVNDGVQISTDGGETWTAADEQPEMACVGERDDGTLFSCGANYEPDRFALARSPDGQCWERVLRFSEIAGPLQCDPGTVQHDTCEVEKWPMTCVQLGVCEQPDGGPSTAPDAGTAVVGDDGKGGCLGCNVALAGLVLVVPRRRRRRHRTLM